MTQWLVEEAVALKDGATDAADSPERREAEELAARHSELMALRDRLRAGS